VITRYFVQRYIIPMKNKQKFERKWKKVHFMPSARTEQGFFCFVSFSPPCS